MAHVRRKFKEAFKVQCGQAGLQKKAAAQALRYIKQLYAIESDIKQSDTQARFRARQDKSVPILNEFKQWLDEHEKLVLPKSPLGKAIRYALNQWDKLIRYCDNGALKIDNNDEERAIRSFTIGRKNWMFAATPEGATANARFYSLIGTAKLHGHDTYAYLKHVFKELPMVETVEGFEQLLPWNVDPEAVKALARDL